MKRVWFVIFACKVWLILQFASQFWISYYFIQFASQSKYQLKIMKQPCALLLYPPLPKLTYFSTNSQIPISLFLLAFPLSTFNLYVLLGKAVLHIFNSLLLAYLPLFYYQHSLTIIISMTIWYFLINFTLHVFNAAFSSFIFGHLINLWVH